MIIRAANKERKRPGSVTYIVNRVFDFKIYVNVVELKKKTYEIVFSNFEIRSSFDPGDLLIFRFLFRNG